MLLLWSSPPIIRGQEPIILEKLPQHWPGPPIVLYKDGMYFEQRTRRIEDEYILTVLKDEIL
jgi:hypothetical protein